MGDWLAEPSLNRLARDSTTIRLTPKAMDLLVFLARHPRVVMTRETIIDAVWAERFVGENVLRRQIAALRKALEDDAASPTYIENIPKRVYRLIARVQFIDSVLPEGPDLGPPTDQRFLCALRWGADDIPLHEGENVIGRTPDSDIQVASERVSRMHALIAVEGGRATIEDLGSKNGTYVDGQRIDAPTELVDGDRINIGPAVLQYCGFFTADTAADTDPEVDPVQG